MGTLKSNEITIGLVCSFKSDLIRADDRLSPLIPADGAIEKDRPWVCVAVENEQSMWAEITKTEKVGCHLPIRDKFRCYEIKFVYVEGKDNVWQDEPQYINGATFVGPNIAWCEASNEGLPARSRRAVSEEALDEIRNFLIDRGNQLYAKTPFVLELKCPQSK